MHTTVNTEAEFRVAVMHCEFMRKLLYKVHEQQDERPSALRRHIASCSQCGRRAKILDVLNETTNIQAKPPVAAEGG